MPSFKLDGREIPFEPGETILKAAWRQGTEIPHYCWHPGLSVAANCRMCLVEIEPGPNQRAMMLDVLRWDAAKQDYVVDRKPKLQPGCQVPAADGMVVKSDSSEHVRQARAHVQEFLLLNHPVDCPICDQAGECKLQDYYMSEQRTAKRMRDEPIHKPKGQVFGPTIVYDAERCIACTRCIRFCDEVVGDHVLDLRERGNLFEITVAPGRQVDGKYTMMLEAVCPVGALTTSHWRHKGRVWLLKGAPSVCPGCATGCNMWLDVDAREQQPFRNRPRDNEQVNKFWMCDDGMLTYLRVVEHRVLHASIGRGQDAAQATVAAALEHAGKALRNAGTRGGVAVVLSAQRSSEDNLAAVELARKLGATLYLGARPSWEADSILRNADANPNRAGALQAAGGAVKSLADLSRDAAGYGAVLLLGADADVEPSTLSALGHVPEVILLTTHKGPLSAFATVTLPVGTWAETDGTFVNAKGLAQTFKKALACKGEALPTWDALVRIGNAAGADTGFRKFAEIRAALSAHGVTPAAPVLNEAIYAPTMTPRSGV